ncbi:MAG: DUF554 domain-containing protein [Gammaproteobacteria bacterium]|nr:DUF554 domain-containing protein [Gammaproteobacteria bacterium]
MLGPWINSGALLLGGALGALLGKIIPKRVKEALPLSCGIMSVSIGAVMMNKVHAIPPVAMALLAGAFIGELLYLEKRLENAINWIQGRITRGSAAQGARAIPQGFIVKFVTILVLFCISGMGIFGSMQEGISGDPTILITKSILDLFTAAIFATELGLAVMLIAIPQIIIQSALFFGAVLLLPLITPTMQADFSACGGIVMLATGLRICGIKIFPIVNMLPALILVMPLSALWMQFWG